MYIYTCMYIYIYVYCKYIYKSHAKCISDVIIVLIIKITTPI